MLCAKCKTNIATFFYTQNINGKETSVALCNKCAESSGLGGTVAPLFGSFFGNAVKKQDSHADLKKCSLCAMTFSDILSMGKVGCPECYNTFKEELSNTIRSIHGGAKHTGLVPDLANIAPKEAKNISQEEALKAELQEAIRTENYEAAATLRDKIKELKGEF